MHFILFKMHAENIANNFPKVNIKSLADPSINKDWAKSLKIKNCYLDPDLVINDEEIDAVIIASPTPTHIEFIKQCSEYKKHILSVDKIAFFKTYTEQLHDLDEEKIEQIKKKSMKGDEKVKKYCCF